MLLRLRATPPPVPPVATTMSRGDCGSGAPGGGSGLLLSCSREAAQEECDLFPFASDCVSMKPSVCVYRGNSTIYPLELAHLFCLRKGVRNGYLARSDVARIK